MLRMQMTHTHRKLLVLKLKIGFSHSSRHTHTYYILMLTYVCLVYEIPACFSTGYGNLIMYNFENDTSKSDKTTDMLPITTLKMMKLRVSSSSDYELINILQWSGSPIWFLWPNWRFKSCFDHKKFVHIVTHYRAYNSKAPGWNVQA